MKKILPVILLAFFCNLQAQQQVENQNPFDYYLELITELSSRNEEETDFNDLAYELYELWESPIDINTATPYDFARLFWLSEYQLNNLIGYVEKQKPILSIFELAYVSGFDTTLVLSLKPFITISEKRDQRYHKKRSSHWLLVRWGKTLERQKGFREGKFEGDNRKESLKYKYQLGEKVQAGFSFEKDGGEAVFKGSNKWGPDFYSGYLKVNNLGKLRTICVGNYNVGFAQGLVCGPGFALGKSSQAVNLIQKETGIRQYTSNDENRFFQGVASTVSFSAFDFSLFLSCKKRDANVISVDSAGKVLQVSSLQTTGYHSTASEIADENSLGEFNAGGRILFKKPRIQAGASFITSRFNAEIVPGHTNYNQFYFRGKQQSNFGVDYKYNFGNTTFFGEEAINSAGDPAFLNGVTANLAGRIQVSLLHRYYSKAYNSFYGNAFGENSKNQNEEGFYCGFRMPLIKNVNVGFYADFFRFPWLKFQVDAPSFGREFMIHTEFRPSSYFMAYLQYRYKQKQHNSPDVAESANNIVSTESNRVRLHAAYLTSEQLSLATRIEMGSYGAEAGKKDKSYLIYQDFRYVFTKVPLQFNLRYAVFETDSYDARMYAYESDVLYAFSVTSYYNKGQRYYAMVKYSPTRNIDFWIKYSQSLYPEEKTISSGLYEIEGNTRSDIRIQVILKF
jgi:hypothetical protein